MRQGKAIDFRLIGYQIYDRYGSCQTGRPSVDHRVKRRLKVGGVVVAGTAVGRFWLYGTFSISKQLKRVFVF